MLPNKQKRACNIIAFLPQSFENINFSFAGASRPQLKINNLKLEYDILLSH